MTYNLTHCDNGIRVASESLPGFETVAICVSLQAGARQESEDAHGLAHLLEHMAFKGTLNRTARQIAEEMDAIGGQINAYTSMEQTVYYIHILKDYVSQAIEMLADILLYAKFDEAELVKEKSVILQEIGAHLDSPEDLIFDHLHELAWPKHELARNILGTTESVKRLTRQQLHDYRNRYYYGSNMVISAAGNICHDRFTKTVEAHFVDLSHQSGAISTAPEFSGGNRHITRNRLEQTQYMRAFEGIPVDHCDYYALQLFSTLFGGGLSSRLFQKIREERGLVYTVQSFLTSYSDCGMLGLYAATGAEQLDDLRDCLQEEISRILQDGISQEETNRAKRQLVAALAMRREGAVNVAEWIARHLQEFGTYRPAKEMIERIESIDKTEIEIAAKKVLGGNASAEVSLGPKATETQKG